MGLYVGNTISNTVITLSSITQNGANGQLIPTGSITIFQQTSAPTGFTKLTTHNDKAMRIVSGSVSTGGSVAFSTAFASQSVAGTVGSTTLSSNQIPGHTHSFAYQQFNNQWSGSTVTGMAITGGNATTMTTDNGTGGGGSHNHTFSGTAINLAVNYVDFILAQAN